MRASGLLREPLLHFLLIGGCLFLLSGWRGAAPPAGGGRGTAPSAQVLVTRSAVDQVTTQFTKTWQRPPSEAERQALVEDLVRNEIFYREALAAGLDRDDEVLKRRLRQKMEFIYEDITALAEPTDADLAAFMEANREKYVRDPEVAFRQVYFNPDRRGPDAGADAGQALRRILAGADPGSAGDVTLLPQEIPLAPLREIRAQFGEEFARALLAAKPGEWTGPVRSGFGLHLVLVGDRRDGGMPAVAAVRDTLKRDWTAAKQRELKEAAYARIRERYRVTVEPPAATATAAAPATGAAAPATGAAAR